MKINRRNFIASSAMLAGAAAARPVFAAPAADQNAPAAANGPLNISAPALQNGAATSMGIAWAVSADANGFVEYSESPVLANAKKVKCGGFHVTGMNSHVMQVRLTGLKPATKYYYRIGADRISYKGGYAMKVVGTEIDQRIFSFTTLGEDAKSSFCVINDTHAQWKAFEMVTDKVNEIDPACVIWNGDACNTQETIDSLIPIFFNPQISNPAYAATIPYLFVSGNHDNRGRAAREIEKVFMFRQPEERSSRDWDLGRNFAQRVGDIAIIGLDTGEDKLDDRDVFAGLFNMEPYREAQADWLADALKRDEIKSAPFIVAFCHIPLFDSDPRSNPGDVDKNGNGRYTHDFAIWHRTCANLWGPHFKDAGVQLVIAAHNHRYRYDAPTADRPWAQIVGGGPELGEKTISWNPRKTVKDPGKFPTVIHGEVKDGRLIVTAHDILNNRVAGMFSYEPRKAWWKLF